MRLLLIGSVWLLAACAVESAMPAEQPAVASPNVLPPLNTATPGPAPSEPPLGLAVLTPAQVAETESPGIAFISLAQLAGARVVVTRIPQNELSVRQLSWLSFDVSLEAAPNARALVAEFVTPSGAVYEPRRLRVDAGATSLLIRLAVAGTQIDQRGLAGVWTLRLLLDGAPFAAEHFEVLR